MSVKTGKLSLSKLKLTKLADKVVVDVNAIKGGNLDDCHTIVIDPPVIGCDRFTQCIPNGHNLSGW